MVEVEDLNMTKWQTFFIALAALIGGAGGNAATDAVGVLVNTVRGCL